MSIYRLLTEMTDRDTNGTTDAYVVRIHFHLAILYGQHVYYQKLFNYNISETLLITACI